jgi:hypothetical protein
MNWLNLNIQTLDSENFIGSDPTERGTWLCLLRYCIGQENMGTIHDCSEWADRKWQQLVRITKKESAKKCDLWQWEGNSLTVWGYPVEKEQEVQEKRERARTNGAKGGRPKGTNAGTEEEPTSVNSAKAEGERKEKGKEYPLTPKGDGEGDLPGMPGESPEPPRCLPKGWQKLSASQKAQTRVNFNTPTMQQLGATHGRRATTLWTVAEAEALLRVKPDEDEIAAMIDFYEAVLPKESDYRRHDLATLLNHWNGELDKARIWKSTQRQRASA